MNKKWVDLQAVYQRRFDIPNAQNQWFSNLSKSSILLMTSISHGALFDMNGNAFNS